MLRREGLICSGLIIFAPLICIGADITHKVGAMINIPLNVKNVQNLSFGIITLESEGSTIEVSLSIDGETARYGKVEQEGHPGIIKVTGSGYISIQSTPPTNLYYITNPEKKISLRNMKIVYSDGSAISNMNNVEINGNLELKTVGAMTTSGNPAPASRGEYKADWPITIDFVGYEPE